MIASWSALSDDNCACSVSEGKSTKNSTRSAPMTRPCQTISLISLSALKEEFLQQEKEKNVFFSRKNVSNFRHLLFCQRLLRQATSEKCLPSQPESTGPNTRSGKIGQDPYGKMALALAGHNTSTSSHKVITSGRTR